MANIKKILEEDRAQAIPKLIHIQARANDKINEKDRRLARIACLSLLEMEHDFANISHYVKEWKMENVFGKDFVIRMKKRVLEDGGK